MAKQTHPRTSDISPTFLIQILSVNPPLALLWVILLNLLPELPVDKSISAGIVPCPGGDSTSAKGAAKTGLFHRHLEAGIAEGMAARQRDRLHKDLHANLAQAVGQGKRGLGSRRHADLRERSSTRITSGPESKKKHLCSSCEVK